MFNERIRVAYTIFIKDLGLGVHIFLLVNYVKFLVSSSKIVKCDQLNCSKQNCK